jgi:urea carboxylase
MWNRYRPTADFTDGKPWVLRFSDQIRFFPVTADELLQLREKFPLGRYRLKVEETVFRLQDYNRFLRENAASIAALKMEINIDAPVAGKVLQVFCREGGQVAAGQDLVVLEET